MCSVPGNIGEHIPCMPHLHRFRSSQYQCKACNSNYIRRSTMFTDDHYLSDRPVVHMCREHMVVDRGQLNACCDVHGSWLIIQSILKPLFCDSDGSVHLQSRSNAQTTQTSNFHATANDKQTYKLVTLPLVHEHEVTSPLQQTAYNVMYLC